MTKLRGREVVDMEIDGIDTKDYTKLCDAFISSAVWGKDGTELSDDDLEELSENGELMAELVQKHLY